MKRRISGISLIIALLMVVPTFTVGATGCPEESLVVVKEVFDGEEWVNEIEAEMDDIVQFRITVTYYNVTQPQSPHWAKNIVVNDTLPPCLEYVEGSAQPEEPEIISDKYLVWDLGDNIGEYIILKDGESYTITFNASVVDYGENVNEVNVTAEEVCTGKTLYGEGEATVCVEEPPEPEPLEFEKLVWDPETQEWVEELDEVRKDTPVRFQITATYHGEDPDHFVDCGVVGDYLPDVCLEYVETVSVKVAGEEIPPGTNEYPYIVPDAGDIIDVCGEPINISELIEDCPWIQGTIMLWDFRGAWNFELHDGESVVIEFETKVTQYCECCTLTDLAFALLWGCYPCDPDNYYFGCDTANVTCTPPDPIFDKKIWDGNDWVDDANVFVGDIVKYKIELTYFGNHYLSDIRIVDELPCILKYADNADPKESNVSEDKKTIWWNLTTDLNDSETLTIEYYVEVTGVTDCEECGKNIVTFTATADECNTQTTYEGEAEAKVTSAVRPPVEIDICIKKSGWGRVSAIIKNVGDEDVSDVEWTITVKGGVLKRLNVDVGSTIDLIEAGKSAGICTGHGSILRKFGRITITVTAIVGEDTFEKTACGFVWGRLIIVRQTWI